MRRNSIPIQTLLLRVFLPAVAVVAIGLGLLTYNRLYDTIVDGFDRKLITTSALTGALIDGRDHDKLIAIARTEPATNEAESSPEYLRNVQPMRQIMKQLNLTYLYTQILGGKKDILYVLDATEDGQHSPLGSEDTLPPETLAGIRRAEAKGSIHLSPIEFQQQWGLLKTAAAPVRGGDGRIVATAGADVNVSLIRVATQNALFASVVIGMASLLACALIILVIVRRVAQPLDRLRREALRIAGGDHRPLDDFPAPSDIASLKGALASSTSEMTGRLAGRREEARVDAREAGIASLNAALECGTHAPNLQFDGPEASDGGALLRRAAASRLAERIAANPTLGEAIERDGPMLVLAEGEKAVVRDSGGRTILIGAAR
jgi:hypothetical protein